MLSVMMASLLHYVLTLGNPIMILLLTKHKYQLRVKLNLLFLNRPTITACSGFEILVNTNCHVTV